MFHSKRAGLALVRYLFVNVGENLKCKQDTLLDVKMRRGCVHYGTLYANHLQAWGFCEQRAELLKIVSPTLPQGLDIGIICATCNEKIQDRRCIKCLKARQMKCTICRLQVRGVSWYCLQCDHGGHADHLSAWFGSGSVVCPSGCGCHCKYLEL
jgi:hypothetical protein